MTQSSKPRDSAQMTQAKAVLKWLEDTYGACDPEIGENCIVIGIDNDNLVGEWEADLYPDRLTYWNIDGWVSVLYSDPDFYTKVDEAIQKFLRVKET